MNTTPYPAEIRVVPRRRRGRARLALLAVTALVLAALAWSPRAQPQATRHSPAAAVTRQHAVHPAPAKAGVTVTVNGTAYVCAAPLKPALKPKK